MKVSNDRVSPWIAPSDLGFASVCTRTKAMNHWVTKKDDLFNVGPIHTLGRPGRDS